MIVWEVSLSRRVRNLIPTVDAKWEHYSSSLFFFFCLFSDPAASLTLTCMTRTAVGTLKPLQLVACDSLLFSYPLFSVGRFLSLSLCLSLSLRFSRPRSLLKSVEDELFQR